MRKAKTSSYHHCLLKLYQDEEVKIAMKGKIESKKEENCLTIFRRKNKRKIDSQYEKDQRRS